MKKKGGKPFVPPWQRPSQWLWLILSLGVTLYLIDIMPPGGEMSSRKKSVETKTVATPETNEQPSSPGHSLKDSFGEKKEPAPSATPKHKSKHVKKAAPDTLWGKVMLKAPIIGNLLMMVAIAAMIGSIAEARKWHLIFGYVLGRFSRLMRLPAIVGIAMPTALYSNTAANSMLVSSHAEGKIEHSTLIAGGMSNSYLSYLSHALRVMYPVIGAVGIPGALFFGGQFMMGFFFILCVLLWHRRKIIREGNEACGEESGATSYEPPLPWLKSLTKGIQRVGILLFRMMMLTVPLMIFVEWLMKKGLFEFWEEYVPDWINRIFPPELMSIVAAQMGGLVQSAAVAANLRDHGVITNAQILLAMLVGSAIGNPFRTLRRNLPSALGIFPAKEALTIVVGMQLSRMIGAILLILITALFIHYTHP